MTERTRNTIVDADDVFAVAHNAALAYRASLTSRSYRPQRDYRQMCDHFREPVSEEGRSGGRGGVLPYRCAAASASNRTKPTIAPSDADLTEEGDGRAVEPFGTRGFAC